MNREHPAIRITLLSAAGILLLPAFAGAAAKPTPELHAIRLDADSLPGPTGGYPVQSDNGLIADDRENGQAATPCGGTYIVHKSVIWNLNGVSRSATSLSSTPLPQPPAASGIQDSQVRAISAGGGFIAGSGFGGWDNLSTCTSYTRAFIWVKGDGGWTLEFPESCDAAGARLGLSLKPATMVWGVNDNGLAAGKCVGTGYSLPVTWTRVSPGVWTLSPLPMGSFTTAMAAGVSSGSGSTANLVCGSSLYPTNIPAVWHCGTDCSMELLPTGAYGSMIPRAPDEFGDMAGDTISNAVVWRYDSAGSSWTLETVDAAGTRSRACDRVGGTLTGLTVVGYYSPRGAQYGMRWTRNGSPWTAQKLQDLDDTSLSVDDAYSVDDDGRITVHAFQTVSGQRVEGRYALVPFPLLAP